jgi:hypothetical protein
VKAIMPVQRFPTRLIIIVVFALVPLKVLVSAFTPIAPFQTNTKRRHVLSSLYAKSPRPPPSLEANIADFRNIPLKTLQPGTAPFFLEAKIEDTIELGDILPSQDSDETYVVSCLSHFGDFNAWELTQQYIAAIDSGRLATRG